jgi:RNA polymerase sigma-70 factor, ECF subfamily
MLTQARSNSPHGSFRPPVWTDDARAVLRGRSDLLQRFRDGDRAALEVVYRAYRGNVTAAVRRLVGLHGWTRHDRTRAEVVGDLVQETFLRAFKPRARRSFDGVREYGPYLIAVARNAVIDWARNRGREVPTDCPVIEDLANARAGTPPENHPEDPLLGAVVERYLEGLDSTLRAVHEIRYQHGLSQRRGAIAMGLSRQSLRTLESRLHDGLRRAIKLHGLSPKARS